MSRLGVNGVTCPVSGQPTWLPRAAWSAWWSTPSAVPTAASVTGRDPHGPHGPRRPAPPGVVRWLARPPQARSHRRNTPRI